MWKNVYKDYPQDGTWTQEEVEPGKGIVGCEMHEVNGWQELQHVPKQPKPGLLTSLTRFLKGKNKKNQ